MYYNLNHRILLDAIVRKIMKIKSHCLYLTISFYRVLQLLEKL